MKSVLTSAPPYMEPTRVFSEKNISKAESSKVSSIRPTPTMQLVPPRRVMSKACRIVVGMPMHSRVKSKPSPAVISASAAGRSSGSTPWVAPKALARSSFPSCRSTATMTAAPAMRAPWMAATPTPPAPMTSTEDPGVIPAVLSAAPTPVVTPQPTRAATSSGTSSSIFTAAIPGTMVSSANVPQPVMAPTTVSPRRNCGLALMAKKPSMHRLGWPRPVQYGQVPHGGEKAMMTWSPGATWVTPSPMSVTTPAPSWPSTAGGVWGIVPFMADRSEWHTPLWAIFTLTSPGAKSRRVTSSATISSSVGVSMRMAASIGFLPFYQRPRWRRWA